MRMEIHFKVTRHTNGGRLEGGEGEKRGSKGGRGHFTLR